LPDKVRGNLRPKTHLYYCLDGCIQGDGDATYEARPNDRSQALLGKDFSVSRLRGELVESLRAWFRQGKAA
jgi:hypothetical protein